MPVGRCADTALRDEPVLTANARKVLEARYLKKNEHGECLEKPADLFRRVAKSVADVETLYGGTAIDRQRWENRFYHLMTSGAFMPNSPTLMNAGREMGMLSACFVLPVRDSIVDIFNSIKHTALIQKAGGGTGFAFDELRPTGDFIKSSGGTTSGPISFWRAFSEATNAIQQGAFRRGANMGMMYIHHPDILKFLHAKQDLTQFTNYNISVKVTDVWMDEFLADPDSPHVVRNPRTGQASVFTRDIDIAGYSIRDLIEVDCVEPVSPTSRECYYRTPRLTGELPAELRGRVYTKRDIWDIIVTNAWQTGEPGVIFIDRINEHNPTPQIGRIEATNPCGEQPLLPYEACNLGSINLGMFVQNPCEPGADIDWEALRGAVRFATRFLDNVIDANNYPLEEIARICRDNRKIGLGVMGFADALFRLGVAYNSEEGVAWAERLMKFINDEAHQCSEDLARERGCFPNWQGSVWQTRHNRMMRNAAVTTVAPTGTISIIANCSGGIEPMFSLAFVRNVLRGQRQDDRPLIEVNETFRGVALRREFYSDELLERIAREGTLAQIDELPEDVKRVFVCAHDIAPGWHARMQAAFQRHCDASISKTINFPNSASPRDVEEIYSLAYELGCKGVTVYRDGCRECQPMALKKEATEVRSHETSEGTTATLPPSDEAKEVAAVPDAGDRGSGIGARRAEVAADPRIGRSEEVAAGLRAGSGAVQEPASTQNARSQVPRCPPSHVAPSTSRSVPNSPHPHFGAAPWIEPMDLPEIVSGLRIRQMTPFGNMHVKITVDPRTDRELEVFAQLGKGGDVANSDLEAICRIVSLWLRSGGNLRLVIKQLAGIGSSLQIPTRAGRIMSLGDGLACALKKYTRAKDRFGLRNLLLGEIDPAEIDNPNPAPHDPERTALDRPLPRGNGGSPQAPANSKPTGAAEVQMRSVPRTTRGNGPQPPRAVHAASDGNNGNGHGKGNGNGNGHVQVAGEPTVEIAEQEQALTAVATMEMPTEARLAAEAEVATVVRAAERRALQPTNLSNILGQVSQRHDAASHYKVKCPECGSTLMLQEGCRKCSDQSCGWSAC